MFPFLENGKVWVPIRAEGWGYAQRAEPEAQSFMVRQPEWLKAMTSDLPLPRVRI